MRHCRLHTYGQRQQMHVYRSLNVPPCRQNLIKFSIKYKITVSYIFILLYFILLLYYFIFYYYYIFIILYYIIILGSGRTLGFFKGF